jgi:hypothetical protein
MKTPIRRLEGISYWVIEDPEGIHDFINNEIRREWEEDARSEQRDPKKDIWLETLSRRTWTLEIAETNQIRVDPRIMNYTDIKTGYNFKQSLAKRAQELRETVERFAVVIWPLVIKEDCVLIDGYCRFAVLKAMNISRVYSYKGTL